ncbi:MAG: hypothetical protein AAF357_04900 [Verrucomicrobiota bacterium]
MHLKKFRVTNFRSTVDSGWIEASDVTALIGENEAGKTNLLLPLWKFNPSGDGEISLLDDMPRNRYAEMRTEPGRHDFITCVFELDEEEQAIAAQHGADPETCRTVEIVRDYDGRYGWSFPDDREFAIHKATVPQEPRPDATDDEENPEDVDAGPPLRQVLAERLPKFVYYSN